MDRQRLEMRRLLKIVLQRILVPLYIGTVLWYITDYFGIMVGGISLSFILAMAYYPLLRPVLEVLDEELAVHRATVQAQRRTTLRNVLAVFPRL